MRCGLNGQRYSSIVKSRTKGLENVQLTPTYPEVTPDSKAFSYVWSGVDVRLGAQPVPITRHCWAVSEKLHCNPDPQTHHKQTGFGVWKTCPVECHGMNEGKIKLVGGQIGISKQHTSSCNLPLRYADS